jgi:L-asparaginase / beta-aspartyl-peptidase
VLLVGSRNGAVGMRPAWDILSAGGSALDAVETACRRVEDDPDEHTVGYGGYPNLVGDVELDASIMDGTTRGAGAVGALRGYRAAITVARQVMERLPHVLLVGEGAARFAAELGLPGEDLLTDQAQQAYADGIAGKLPPEYRDQDGAITNELLEAVRLAADPESVLGTVNFLAQDSHGRIASAVSTSGWAWKYPGRIGDTALIGAGNYADDRYGAAACMGWGELAIRAGTARSIVAEMERGNPVPDACLTAFADLDDLSAAPVLHTVAIDTHGNHTGVTTSRRRHYLAWEEGWSSYTTVDCHSAG